MRPILPVLSVTIAGLAAPAIAQTPRTFSLPAGCTAYVTVQSRSCQVSHHFTCDADAAGLQRRVDLNEDGVTYMGMIDAETQWIESFHVLSGHTERLAPNPDDPASFTELTTTGANRYDFRTLSDEIGTSRFVGEDRLTGETVVIDGVTLERTDYDITAFADDGSEMWRATGSEYISRDWRMFLSGTSTYVTPSDSFTDDNSPMEFIFPDEPGFLSANPKYGCGEMMSQAGPVVPAVPAAFR